MTTFTLTVQNPGRYPGEHTDRYYYAPNLHAVWQFDDGVRISARNAPDGHYNTRSGYGASKRYPVRDLDKKVRVYVSDQRPYDVIAGLADRCRRPHDLWRPLAVEALARIGIEGKLAWSQKAGCNMCPCSPGFILTAPGMVGWDLWIEIPDVAMVDESIPARDLVVAL